MKDSVLYFLPGFKAEDLFQLKENSFAASVVADVFDPADVAMAYLPEGPSGGPGTLFAVSGQSGEAVDGFGFHVADQDWKQTAGDVWVGWKEGFRVGPKDLERRSCPASESQLVAFADGSHWEVPMLRDPMVQVGSRQLVELDPNRHSTSLRTTHFRDEKGCWQFDVEQQYVDLFQQSRQWWTWIIEKAERSEVGSQADDFPGVFQYAIQVIGLRYRYTQALHDATRGRLLDTDVASQIVMVSCGWSVASRLLQKKSRPLLI